MVTSPAPAKQLAPRMRLMCRLRDLPRLASEIYLRNERSHLTGPAT